MYLEILHMTMFTGLRCSISLTIILLWCALSSVWKINPKKIGYSSKDAWNKLKWRIHFLHSWLAIIYCTGLEGQYLFVTVVFVTQKWPHKHLLRVFDLFKTAAHSCSVFWNLQMVVLAVIFFSRLVCNIYFYWMLWIVWPW